MNEYSQIEKILLKHGKFHISLELDRIQAVLNLLGNPQDKIKIIHVAGTNGKGSVCSMLSSILCDAGYKTGLYTSPHFVKYNERIKINGSTIPDSDFLKLVKKITDLAEKNNIYLTEFEILTAVMFEHFASQKVDFAIVEVGLGGRFDATNCIKTPFISIITSVSYDHTERLGNTIQKIAFEKAGIIKKNCPVIFDKNNLGVQVLTEIAKKNNSPIFNPKPAKIIYNGKNYVKYGEELYETALLGKYQAQNTALCLCACEALKIDKKNIKNGLKKVKWPGRFEYIKNKNIVIDGCHNPDGAKQLKESLDFYFPKQKRIFVYTALKNKDYKTFQKTLFNKNDKIYHYKMETENFISEKEVENILKSIDINGLKELIKNKSEKDLLIICGSLYAIGDILGKIKLCNF